MNTRWRPLGGIILSLFALTALGAASGCHSEVTVGGDGGAAGSMGSGAAGSATSATNGGSTTGNSVGTSTGSSAGTSTGSLGSSTGSGGNVCEHVVGQAQAGSACDNTGICGGVSEAGGCINCALQAGCSTPYLAWVNQPNLADWNMCRSNCYDDVPFTEWDCCFLDCDSSYPAIANAYDAFVNCINCEQCPNDCGLAIDFGRICAP